MSTTECTTDGAINTTTLDIKTRMGDGQIIDTRVTRTDSDILPSLIYSNINLVPLFQLNLTRIRSKSD
eukprot:scaffold42298_cov205-Skeletonema_dohrnii-CCMP3373.AAC.1